MLACPRCLARSTFRRRRRRPSACRWRPLCVGRRRARPHSGARLRPGWWQSAGRSGSSSRRTALSPTMPNRPTASRSAIASMRGSSESSPTCDGRVLDVGCGPAARPSYVPRHRQSSSWDRSSARSSRSGISSSCAAWRSTSRLPREFDRVFSQRRSIICSIPSARSRGRARARARGRVVSGAACCRRRGCGGPPTPHSAPCWARHSGCAADAPMSPRRPRSGRSVPLRSPRSRRDRDWVADAGLEVVERARLTKPSYSAFLAASRG